jgi:hypothetical protein
VTGEFAFRSTHRCVGPTREEVMINRTRQGKKERNKETDTDLKSQEINV